MRRWLAVAAVVLCSIAAVFFIQLPAPDRAPERPPTSATSAPLGSVGLIQRELPTEQGRDGQGGVGEKAVLLRRDPSLQSGITDHCAMGNAMVRTLDLEALTWSEKPALVATTSAQVADGRDALPQGAHLMLPTQAGLLVLGEDDAPYLRLYDGGDLRGTFAVTGLSVQDTLFPMSSPDTAYLKQSGCVLVIDMRENEVRTIQGDMRPVWLDRGTGMLLYEQEGTYTLLSLSDGEKKTYELMY